MTDVYQNFIHLRVHSTYSLLEGAIPINDLADLCIKYNMPALGVADSGNLFGCYEISQALSTCGIQPVIGSGIWLVYADHEFGRHNAGVVLYAQSETGYRNLAALSTESFLDDTVGYPSVTVEKLEKYSEGLICLTGGAKGAVGQCILAGKLEDARALLERLAEIYAGKLYVEIHRHGFGKQLYQDEEQETETFFLTWAEELNLPLVAVNEVFFASVDMKPAYEAMVCISDGTYANTDNRATLADGHYFRSPEEMVERFSDLPDAIENTIEIAMRCTFFLQPKSPVLPKFCVNEEEEFRRKTREGFEERKATTIFCHPDKVYCERLEYEISVIISMGFAGYFLIVADFIKWAHEQNIPVGPGRGSGAGSLVAYSLAITDLDPLRYNLLFERFLNPDRVSMPDFDIDFCQERRDDVLQYVQKRYGYECVAQISTFGKLQAKAALRDVGRVLQIPYPQVDKICRALTTNPSNPVTLVEAYNQQPKFRNLIDQDRESQRLLEISCKIEGMYRHASTHAAGVVISDQSLRKQVPLYKDPSANIFVTQFNMKSIESVGLVKFDLLGLKTLTIIHETLMLLHRKGIDIDISKINLSDSKTYDLYGNGETVAVFQVESAGMREALRQLKPNCIEDIIAIVALYRPGPIDNIQKYCSIKHGREQVTYLHPKLEDILSETHGIIVYQEQVMEICQAIAGYSLSQADIVRRAMGKKIQAEMDKQSKIFVENSVANGVSEETAREISELLLKFANYGFNKSHAAAYGVLSYQTAWLKANYPVEFIAATMNSDLHNTDKISLYNQELKRLEIELATPCVNTSGTRFNVQDGKIMYALSGLKNVGSEVIHSIEKERDANGKFRDISDFCTRVDLKKIGKRALESLIRAGAYDNLCPNRKSLFSSIDILVQHSSLTLEEKKSSQSSLFGKKNNDLPFNFEELRGWERQELLAEERKAVGFFLSGHPLDDHIALLSKMNICTYQDLVKSMDESGGTSYTGRIGAYISGIQERRSHKGKPFVVLQLSDPYCDYECTVFPDSEGTNIYELETGSCVVLKVELVRGSEQQRLRAKDIESMDSALGVRLSGYKIFVTNLNAAEMLCSCLRALPVNWNGLIDEFSDGNVLIVIRPHDFSWEAEIAVPGCFCITSEIRREITSISGISGIETVSIDDWKQSLA
jgi:DNA polymerase-3 subunit alpha